MLLRTLKGAQEKMDQQTIFNNPTVKQLADVLVRLHNGEQRISPPTLDLARCMIQKYSSNWPERMVLLEAHDVANEHVVVTGTTGGLGSYLLATLLENEKVKKVWALNRKSNEGVAARQRVEFEDKLLDVGLLNSDKLLMLEVILDEKMLGMDEIVYRQVGVCGCGGIIGHADIRLDSKRRNCNYSCMFNPQCVHDKLIGYRISSALGRSTSTSAFNHSSPASWALEIYSIWRSALLHCPAFYSPRLYPQPVFHIQTGA